MVLHDIVLSYVYRLSAMIRTFPAISQHSEYMHVHVVQIFNLLQFSSRTTMIKHMIDMLCSVTSAACITAMPFYYRYPIVSFSHAFNVSLFNKEEKNVPTAFGFLH